MPREGRHRAPLSAPPPWSRPGDAPGLPGGPGTAWRPAPAQPRASRPLSAPDRELRHRALAALTFGMLALVALLGLGADLHRGVYLLLFSAAIGLAACVIGITALKKSRRTGAYRPRGAVGGILTGALAALLSTPLLVMYLAYPTQTSNYFTCASQAQSSAQFQACMHQFLKSAHLGALANRDPIRR